MARPTNVPEAETVLAFAALDLRLSNFVQSALSSGRLQTARGRRAIRREAQHMISTFRSGFRPRMLAVIEAAYGTGARTVGARPSSVMQRSSLGHLLHASAVDVSAPLSPSPPSRRPGVPAPQKKRSEPLSSVPRRAGQPKPSSVPRPGRTSGGAEHPVSPVDRLDGALDTVGRQVDDIFRKVGLKHAARQLSRELPQEAAVGLMRQELEEHGLTAFVDKGGRHWTLSNYSRMVIVTTTSEAANRGVIDAVLAVGRDLVRISVPEGHHCKHHPKDPNNPCRALEGKTVSLTGRTPGYPKLERIPPFHPFCHHGVAPAPELEVAR